MRLGPELKVLVKVISSRAIGEFRLSVWGLVQRQSDVQHH